MANEMTNTLVELQDLQSRMQAYMVEKQQLSIQLNEIDRAIKALKGVEGKTYEMIGTVLVERDPKEIERELLEKKEMLDLRLESIDKNVRTIKSRMETLASKLNGPGMGPNMPGRSQ